MEIRQSAYFLAFFLSDRSGLLVRKAWKVDANIWWEIVKWPPLLGSRGDPEVFEGVPTVPDNLSTVKSLV